MKSIILLVVALFAMTACTVLQPGKTLETKKINVCSFLDEKDCVDFIIPAEHPDFINDFRDSGMCMGVYPQMMACFWNDGIEAEDGTIPTAVWYTLYYWTDGYTMASSKPFCLEVESHIDFEEEWAKYYVYSDDGIPEQVSYYEYRMQFFDLEGVPRVSEEEFNIGRKQELEERKKAIKEFKQLRNGKTAT